MQKHKNKKYIGRQDINKAVNLLRNNKNYTVRPVSTGLEKILYFFLMKLKKKVFILKN